MHGDQIHSYITQLLSYIKGFLEKFSSFLTRTVSLCFSDDQLELLILKARRTLESSAEDLASIMKNDGSPCTVDILEAERSWENVPIAL